MDKIKSTFSEQIIYKGVEALSNEVDSIIDYLNELRKYVNRVNRGAKKEFEELNRCAELHKKLINRLADKVEAVEILFNNINEINYINKEIKNNEK